MQPSGTTLHSTSRKFIKLSTDFRRHRLLIVAVVVVVHSSLCSVLCYLLVFPCSILSFVICFFVVVERNWPLCAFFQFREGYLPLNQITSIRGKNLELVVDQGKEAKSAQVILNGGCFVLTSQDQHLRLGHDDWRGLSTLNFLNLSQLQNRLAKP